MQRDLVLEVGRIAQNQQAAGNAAYQFDRLALRVKAKIHGMLDKSFFNPFKSTYMPYTILSNSMRAPPLIQFDHELQRILEHNIAGEI